MKKLINILSVITISSSSLSAVVACRNDKKTVENLTGTQEDIFSGASFITKLIIASRHENLNVNVNELLSMFITPEASISRFPQSYDDKDGNKVNTNLGISNYKKFLAPSITTLDQDKYAGTMASYVMGMYDNDFYKPIISGEKTFYDTMDVYGNEKYNQIGDGNAMGYLAGFNKDINLSSDVDRRNLAWGIQDTGPLTNYLLNQGFDGSNPGDTRANMGADGELIGAPRFEATGSNGGTNGSGYAYYNSIMAAGEAAKNGNGIRTKVSEKLKTVGSQITYTSAETKVTNGSMQSSVSDGTTTTKFNEAGASIMKNAQTNNINGGVAMLTSMLENISTTNSGALLTSEFANYLMPFLSSGIGTETVLQAIGFGLVTSVWQGFTNMKDAKYQNIKTIVGDDIFNKATNLISAPKTLPAGIMADGDSSVTNISVLKKYNGGQYDNVDLSDNGSNATMVIELISDLIAQYNSKAEADKTNFVSSLFGGSDSVFGSAYFVLPMFLGEDVWNNLVQENNGSTIINLLKFVRSAYQMALNDEVLAQVENAKTIAKGVNSYRNLTSTQKSQIARALGYNGSTFEKESYLGLIYQGFKDENVEGNPEFNSLFQKLKLNVNNGMKDIHENFYQYIFDDKYWKLEDPNINVTSNEDLTGELEFTLKYSGKGDSSSTASNQTKAVEVPQNFNPYQTILENQTNLGDNAPKDYALNKIDGTRVSGKVLGLEQNVITEDELINYDGTSLFSNYKDVNFEYKVKWKNISSDVTSPYWVISKIDCFNNGVQFYNIY